MFVVDLVVASCEPALQDPVLKVWAPVSGPGSVQFRYCLRPLLSRYGSCPGLGWAVEFVIQGFCRITCGQS